MIKYWDGYKYKYSPSRKKEPVKVQPRVEFDDEPIIIHDVIHHSKQNGYRNVWYDATNAVHPMV
jgi:hypothetical protein